jgi:hypothetical protein
MALNIYISRPPSNQSPVPKTGISVVVSTASSYAGFAGPWAAAGQYLVGWVIGEIFLGQGSGPDVRYVNLTLGGTKVGFDVGFSELKMYHIEGRASLSDSSGKEVSITEGQMLRIETEGNLSDPIPFTSADFSPSLRSALEGTGRGDNPGATMLPIPVVEVVSLRFYEGGYDKIPLGQRTYEERFSKSESRYIKWELKLKFPPPGRRIDFDIDAVWYRPDGSVLTPQIKKAYVESGWEGSFHTIGRGWRTPGNWEPGKYRVELFVDGQKIAEGFFEIDNL